MELQDESSTSFTGDYAHDFKVWSEYYNSKPELDILSKYSKFANKDILEVGCGSGRLSFRIARDDFSLTCVDIVPSLIKNCHKKLIRSFDGDPTSLRFEVQNAQNLPYPDNHFDAILDAWTFSTHDDFDEGAAEYKRVLDQEGTIYAIEYREGSPYQQIIDEFVPEDTYDEDLPEPDMMMKNAFGSPDVTEDIVSEYIFESKRDAFEALWFNLTEWIGLDLSEDDAEKLNKKIDSHDNGENVIISEYAKFYLFEI